MEYYAVIKNEILPFAMTWMEQDGIMLSKKSESEKDNYHMIWYEEFEKQDRGS